MVSQSLAGFLLQKELDYLDGAVKEPKRPFAAIVGGSKVRPLPLTLLANSRKQLSALQQCCCKESQYVFPPTSLRSHCVKQLHAILFQSTGRGVQSNRVVGMDTA